MQVEIPKRTRRAARLGGVGGRRGGGGRGSVAVGSGRHRWGGTGSRRGAVGVGGGMGAGDTARAVAGSGSGWWAAGCRGGRWEVMRMVLSPEEVLGYGLSRGLYCVGDELSSQLCSISTANGGSDQDWCGVEASELVGCHVAGAADIGQGQEAEPDTTVHALLSLFRGASDGFPRHGVLPQSNVRRWVGGIISGTA